MRQVVFQDGTLKLLDVPPPALRSGFLLIRSEYSCVSVGTELASLRSSSNSLVSLAMRQPEKVSKAIAMVRNEGLASTISKIKGLRGDARPSGYSASGMVMAIGSGVTGFDIGDRVASAGAGYANHAEVICVPKNLVVKLPDSVSSQSGAVVTLGAIAMQSVRRAQVSLGEVVVVYGLGLIGQLVVQILKAAGCRVIGLDISDPACERANSHGADVVVNTEAESAVPIVEKCTNGIGADAVIVAASSKGDEIIHLASNLCRKKGRLVIVGDIGLSMRREDIYTKELDVLISTSYGPGRYDSDYEEGGHDYPLPFVRWTENRNMDSFVSLLDQGVVCVESLIREPYSLREFARAFAENEAELLPIRLIKYPANENVNRDVIACRHPTITNMIRVGVIGVGEWSMGRLLPELSRIRGLEISGIASRDGLKAAETCRRYDAQFATSDYQELINHSAVDLVVVATRHDTHGQLTLSALEKGKSVFVEKPLTISREEHREIEHYFANTTRVPLLVTGYNRRFSPSMVKLKEKLAPRKSPIMVNYTLNAGFLDSNHWTQGMEGGGRNLGEACHIYDLFIFLTGDSAESVSVESISNENHLGNSNFAAVIKFSQGSVCTLFYSAMGNSSFPKEQMHVFSEGEIFYLNDYKQLTSTYAGTLWSSKTSEKGHHQILNRLVNAFQESDEWPISLKDQLEASRIAFLVEDKIQDLRY